VPDLARFLRESPRLLFAALEAPRALAEAATLAPSAPLLWSAPKGDGHDVLVLPGFLADDASTAMLRRYLGERGYTTHSWGLGRNLGPRPTLGRRLASRVRDLYRETGRTISLVGWSLGGIYARELARAQPHAVRQVISLGSPFGRAAAGARTRVEAPPVPCTAIYSRSDGVVRWQMCREAPGARSENIEVRGSHVGLGFNPLVLYAIADRLALPEGNWRPFERSGFRKILYPTLD